MQKLILIISVIFLSYSTFAQETKQQRKEEKRQHKNALIKEEEEGVIAYRKSFVFGAKLISDGYGVFFEKGIASSVKKAVLFQLDISERKNVKEEKLSNSGYNSIPFIFGKENFFYPVKLGVQQQMLLGNKANKNGVSITANYGGGIAMAILRPYYLQVADSFGNYVYVKYNTANSTYFDNPSLVTGGPTFGKGWSDISVTPGLYAKAAVRFDYGSYNELISAIEVGVSGDYYSKKIPILIGVPQRSFFFSGYVSICFGKRK